MIVDVKTLANFCGIKAKNIHTYIVRGKIIKRNNEPPEDIKNVSNNIPEKANEEIIKPDSEKKSHKIDDRNNDAEYIPLTEGRKLQNEKLAEEIKYAKLKNERYEGKLIPTDLVQRAISEVIQRHKQALAQGTEQHLRQLLNELSASNEIITAACTKNTEIINDAFSRAIFETKQSIKNVASESLNI